MVKTLIFIFLFAGLPMLLHAQDLQERKACPGNIVLQSALGQTLERHIEVVGPLHLARQKAIVAISSNCRGDSSGTGPIIRGGRADQVIAYIDGIPVRGGGAVSIEYAEEKWLPGIPAEYEYVEPKKWTW